MKAPIPRPIAGLAFATALVWSSLGNASDTRTNQPVGANLSAPRAERSVENPATNVTSRGRDQWGGRTKPAQNAIELRQKFDANAKAAAGVWKQLG